MSSVIGRLRAILSLDSAQFEKGLSRSRRSMAAFARRVVMAAKVAAAAVVAAGAAMVRSSLRTVDAQAKLAQSLGTTTASIQVLTRAGDLAGVSMSSVEQATKDLTRRLSQAATGTGPAVAALDRLGLSASDLLALPLDQRIAAIDAAIQSLVPETERLAVAGQIAGEEGSISFLRLAGTVGQANSELRETGVLLSDFEADEIEAANDALSRMGLAARGAANQFTVGLAPAINDIATSLSEASRGQSNFFRDAGEWVSGLVRGVRAAGLSIQVLVLELRIAWNNLVIYLTGKTADAVNTIAGAFRGAFAAVGEIWKDLPVVLGSLMIDGANAAIDAVESMINGIVRRINNFIEDVNSLINRLPERFRPEGGTVLVPITEINLPGIPNPFAEQAANAVRDAAAAFNEAFAKKVWEPDTSNRAGAVQAFERAALMFRMRISEIKAGAEAATPAVNKLAAGLGDALAPDAVGDSTGSAGGGGGGGGGGGSSPAAEAIRDIADVATDAAVTVSDAGRQMAQGILDPLKDALKSSEGAVLSFREAAARILEGWRDRLIDSVFAPIENALANLFSGGGGGGGFWGSIIGAFTGGLGGGGSAAASSASMLAGGIYHKGGIAGSPSSSRLLPAAVWAGAARYHGGGIAGLRPDEIPAVLQRGERVLPRGADPGGAVTVYVTLDRDMLRGEITSTSGNVAAQVVEGYRHRVLPRDFKALNSEAGRRR